MIKFDDEKILLMHKLLIESTGGEYGLRDYNLLDAAINSPFQTFANIELYPTKEEKAARLAYNLISYHAFVDGNKRIGILAMLSFLEINGIKVEYTDEELIELGLKVANQEIKYDDLVKSIKSHKIKENNNYKGYELLH